MNKFVSRLVITATLIAAPLIATAASAQVGQTLAQFEAQTGTPIDSYKTDTGSIGLIFNETWGSNNGAAIRGKAAIEFDQNGYVNKEVFSPTVAFPNTPAGLQTAIGIVSSIVPDGTPSSYYDHGLRAYPGGWVVWFDFGDGRYTNFMLNQPKTQIEAICAGIQDVSL